MGQISLCVGQMCNKLKGLIRQCNAVTGQRLRKGKQGRCVVGIRHIVIRHLHAHCILNARILHNRHRISRRIGRNISCYRFLGHNDGHADRQTLHNYRLSSLDGYLRLTVCVKLNFDFIIIVIRIFNRVARCVDKRKLFRCILQLSGSLRQHQNKFLISLWIQTCIICLLHNLGKHQVTDLYIDLNFICALSRSIVTNLNGRSVRERIHRQCRCCYFNLEGNASTGACRHVLDRPGQCTTCQCSTIARTSRHVRSSCRNSIHNLHICSRICIIVILDCINNLIPNLNSVGRYYRGGRSGCFLTFYRI